MNNDKRKQQSEDPSHLLSGFSGIAGKISRERFAEIYSQLKDVPEASGSVAAVFERITE